MSCGLWRPLPWECFQLLRTCAHVHESVNPQPSRSTKISRMILAEAFLLFSTTSIAVEWAIWKISALAQLPGSLTTAQGQPLRRMVAMLRRLSEMLADIGKYNHAGAPVKQCRTYRAKTYLMPCSSSVHGHLVRLRECLKKTGFVYQELTEIPFAHTISLKIVADENCFICVVR